MRKYITIFLLLGVLFIAACSNNGDSTSSTGSDQSTESATAVPTAAPVTTANDTCKQYNIVDDIILAPVDDKVPAVTDEDLSYGPADAKYTFITYSNFTCSHCASLEPILESLQSLFPQDVRIVFRYVATSENSYLAAQAAEASNMQGKFTEMKDVLFENQATWYYYTTDEFHTWLDEQATAFGMDVDQFNTDMEDEETKAKIDHSRETVNEIGITGTPTLYVNNRQYHQSRSLALFEILINLMENSDRMLGTCPSLDTDFSGDLQAVISTTKGDIIVDLYEDEAPYTVAYFKYLVENGWYENNDVFVATSEYMISGDPTNTQYGNPGFAFYNEPSEQALDEEGLLVSFNMLGVGYNTGMFMITKGTVTGYEFPYGYSVFGKVIEGMDVLNTIEDRSFSLDPAELFTDSITNITIVEK